MQFLDVIETHAAPSRRLELWQGDLTDLAPEHGVDALVVSAFPDNYVPTSTSLIGALDRKGISVEGLSRDKDIDLRSTMSCWLSQQLSPEAHPGFRRILVFEPNYRDREVRPPEVVGDIFRSLMPITTVRPEIRSIALPIVAAGNMGYPIAGIVEPLVDAATHWLDAGLPLERVVLVAFRETHAAEAQRAFTEAKATYIAAAKESKSPVDYDVFISYSRKNAAACDLMIEALREHRPDIRVFVDRYDINPGVAWQTEIFESLDRCTKVVALLSPEYLASPMCQEELSIALARDRTSDRRIVFPVYLYTSDLPTYISMRNYIDCREGDESGLRQASKALIDSLGEA